MSVDQRGVDMLGQHVGEIVGAWGRGPYEVAGFNPIRHPQAGNSRMANRVHPSGVALK